MVGAMRSLPHIALLVALASSSVACGSGSDPKSSPPDPDGGSDVLDASDSGADTDANDGGDAVDGGDAGDDAVDADVGRDGADADDGAGTELGEPYDWCGGLPPDDACFAARRDPDSDLVSLARLIADKVVETRDPTELRWDWGEAVMLVGLMRTARVTGDERYVDFVARYVDHHIARGYTLETSDTSAPAALAVALIAAGRDEARYRDVVADALEYYASEALRTPEGGISHFGTLELFGAQLWADSLFMFGNVMTGWGALADDRELLDTYAEQYAIFARLMQQGPGFFVHAVYASFEQEPDVYWARANGWILAAGYEHASLRIDRGERSGRVEGPAARLAAAAIASQDAESGLWWTVLNRPGETYLETSASALFAFGLARAWRYGLLGEEALGSVEAAVSAVVSRVTFDPRGVPTVTGISGPTSVGGFRYYANIPVGEDISFGIGATLLALTEASGLPIDVPVRLPEQVAPVEGEPVDFGPTEGFETRRAAYLDLCIDRTDPGEGGLYGQVCRAAVGGLVFDTATIESSMNLLRERRDTADFRANALVRLLYLDDETDALGDTLRASIEQTLFEFKYWIDQPGEDGMAYWTENHQILFHTAELLVGQRWPDTVLPNSGMTGAEHVAHALPRLRRWLDLRGRYGFSEWHSNVYFNEDIPALINLVDYAEDEEVRQGARMVLDIIAVDLATNMFRGTFATTAGRTYRSKFIGGSSDSTAEFAWIALGLGSPRSPDNFGATFLATSSWFPPPILEALAAEVAPRLEHRQRDSFDVEERHDAGVGLEGLDEVVIWAGQSAIVHPDVIDGAMVVMDEYDLWDGFLFGSLPRSVLNLIRSFIGTPQLRNFALELEPLSDGIALEGVDTYVYRTPDYQLAAAQDWKPGMWSAQTLLWRAALDTSVSVLTTAPALLGGLGAPEDVTIDDPWIGGWMPRVTAHRNVAVVQYHKPDYAPIVDSVVAGTFVHAYFPVGFMDEWRHEGSWLFGRVGDSYVGLWSEGAYRQSTEHDYEWIVDATENVFVIELGSADENGDFASFTGALAAAEIALEEASDGSWDVRYASPSLGAVEVGWTGPLVVAGETIDIGPYERWQTPNVHQRRGSRVMDVTLGDETLRLDFRALERTLYAR